MERKLKININVDKLNTCERKLKAINAEVEMKIVINSPIFLELFHTLLLVRDYKNNERSIWKDATPVKIINHFYSGAETLNPIKDGEMNIDIDDYWSFKRVIGYTKAAITTIFVNTRYFDKRTSKKIGSNFVHEWGHKLGFSHDFWNTKGRENSLCYLLNLAYETAYEMVIENEL